MRERNVQGLQVAHLDSDGFRELQAGQTAKFVTSDLEIGPGLASVMPLPTTIALIAATGKYRTYIVTTRGYTVEQLLAVVVAYANGSLLEADRLVGDLQPPVGPPR